MNWKSWCLLLLPLGLDIRDHLKLTYGNFQLTYFWTTPTFIISGNDYKMERSMFNISILEAIRRNEYWKRTNDDDDSPMGFF